MLTSPQGPTPSLLCQGVPLHTIMRGSNREAIFGNDEDCQFFKETLQDAARRHDVAIHAYVFMTNHVHLLASPGAAESVPKAMQSVGRRYVQYFNFRYR
jgi:putative transposase